MTELIKQYAWLRYLADYCGVNLLFAAEIFAVLPYALRSYRIQKIFEALQEYWRTDCMPKEKLQAYSQKRLFTFLGMLLLMINCAYLPI